MSKGYKTVLVFGAGISKPYGFPLASELLPLIGDLRGDQKFRVYASTHNLDSADLDAFYDSTMIQYHGTIDEYLRKNPRHIPIGLAAIAWIIMQHERKSAIGIVTNPQSFYRVIFDLLKLDPEKGQSAYDISIITLNYDRSLEYWLGRMIDLCVGESEKVVARTRLAGLKIHHLHNSLGTLEQLPYATPPTDGVVRDVSTRLMTIHRRDEVFKASYQTARDMMQHAAMVFILGCSYDPTIFRDLFPGVLDGGFRSRTGISRIFGTVIGHNETMKQQISQVFGPNDLIQAKSSEQPVGFLPRAVDEFHQLALRRTGEVSEESKTR